MEQWYSLNNPAMEDAMCKVSVLAALMNLFLVRHELLETI